MQIVTVLASLVSELAGGENDPPPILNVTKNAVILEGLKTLQPHGLNERLLALSFFVSKIWSGM